MPKSSDTGHHGDSAHKNNKIGLFTDKAMSQCIKEVKAVEARQKELGLAKPENHEIKSARNTVYIHQPSQSK